MTIISHCRLLSRKKPYPAFAEIGLFNGYGFHHRKRHNPLQCSLEVYTNAFKLATDIWFIPFADVQVNIPTDIKIIGHDIATVMITVVQYIKQFGQAIESST